MSKKILILDDDPHLLAMLREALIYEDYEVKVVSELAGFLKAFDEGYQPDLVIIDYLLKGINGGDVCYQLKINEKTSSIPVLLMSGYPQIFQSLGEYKCDEFIAKPFDLYELVKCVKSHLNTAERITTKVKKVRA